MKQTTYVFRLDDISWNMNARNFIRIRDIFVRYGIRPLIGVIPCNQDEKLVKRENCEIFSQEAFWKEIKTLQDTYGWTIALHGFKHVYRTRNSGLFRINNRSEFAGVPYDEQVRMIGEGKEILESRGLKVEAFMAPAHSLDWNTVAALRRNGITVVTDGIAAYPYRKQGVWFIPQVANWPDERIWGIESVCFHTDNWTEQKFSQFEVFLQKKAEVCCDFQTVIERAVNGEYEKERFRNLLSRVRLKLYVFARKARYSMSRAK